MVTGTHQSVVGGTEQPSTVHPTQNLDESVTGFDESGGHRRSQTYLVIIVNAQIQSGRN
jgi:hypothetical protein